jgi:hypothetical protein
MVDAPSILRADYSSESLKSGQIQRHFGGIGEEQADARLIGR